MVVVEYMQIQDRQDPLAKTLITVILGQSGPSCRARYDRPASVKVIQRGHVVWQVKGGDSAANP